MIILVNIAVFLYHDYKKIVVFFLQFFDIKSKENIGFFAIRGFFIFTPDFQNEIFFSQ
jgi:hypothetical protein